MVKVTIIVPVYNVEPYLKQALDSLVNQTLKDIEIICVNDGSTDNSAGILEDYASKDNRIIVINQENQGQGIARNNGLKIAKGEYLTFVDPDDWVELDMCEKMYNKAKELDLDLLETPFIIYKELKNTIRKNTFDNTLPQNKVFNHTEVNNYIFHRSLAACGKFFRTKLINEKNINFTEGSFAEDQIFVIKYRLNANRIILFPENFYTYRVRIGSSTRSINKDVKNRLILLKNVQDYLIKTNFYKKYQQEFLNYFISEAKNAYIILSNDDKESFNQDIKNTLDEESYKKYICAIKSNIKLSQKLFSIKNELIDGSKYKVIRLLGLRFKLKKIY